MKAAIGLLLMLLLAASVTASAISVTNSQYIDSRAGFDGPVWMVLFRSDNIADRSADYIQIGQPQSINGTTASGQPVKPQHSFQLESHILSESCVYDLTYNANKADFYKYDISKEASGIYTWNVADAFSRCKAKGADYWWYEKSGVFTYDVFCLNKVLEAKTGDISAGRINFNAQFKLIRDDGTTLQQSITKQATDSSGIPPAIEFDDSGKKVAVIDYIGGVLFTEWCPTQAELISVQGSNNQWYAASKDQFTLYAVAQTDLEDYINNLDDKLFNGRWPTTQELDTLKEKVVSTNSREQTAKQAETISTATEAGTIQGATLVLPLARDHLIYAPDFQAFITADWLKVVYLSGQPKITKASFSHCSEGSTSNSVDVVVQNVGTTTGMFSAGITCESGISVKTSQDSLTLAPGATGTISFDFDISLNADANKGCVVTVVDSRNPSAKDTASASSLCKATTFCNIEGQTVCQGQVEQVCKNGNWVATGRSTCVKCNGDGKCDATESFEACGGATSPQNDCATCNNDGSCGPTETGYSCPKDCNITPATTTPWWVWALGGGGVAAALYFGFTKKPFGKKRRRR